MSKAERAAALTQRRNAVAIIKNLRFTRRFLASHPFDEATFSYIDGKDRGIENLVGHEVVFAALGEDEKLALRREIVAKLNESEKMAFSVLRASTESYFKDLVDIINKDIKKVDPKAAVYFDSKKQAVLEAFEQTITPAASFDCERAMSALEKLDLIAEEIETTVPDIEHELDEDEVKEEEHDHEDGSYGDQTGETIPPAPEEDEDDDDDDDDDLDEDVKLPEDDEDADEDVVEPAEPDDGSIDADDKMSVTAKTHWVAQFHSYIDSAKNFVAKEDFQLGHVGFTAEKAKYILDKYAATMEHYKAALEKLYAVVDPATCTADSLLRGKVSTYKRIDKIVALADRMEEVRASLDKSLESLLTASRNMMLAATYDPMRG